MELLRTLPISPLVQASPIRLYRKGQTILFPNDEGLHLYVIKDGAVLMHSLDEADNRKILNIFGPNTLFPMVSFQDEAVHSGWFYTAHTDTEVYRVSYQELKQYLNTHPESNEIYSLILRQTLKEVHELLVRILDHTKTDSAEKLTSILLFLLKYHTTQDGAWRHVRFPVPHQLLADMTGLTRETVGTVMKEFAARQLIRYPSKSVLDLHDENMKHQHHSV